MVFVSYATVHEYGDMGWSKGSEPRKSKVDQHSELSIVLRRRDLFSETYCGGYSGEDPPLPIPNREVKLTIADGTAPPGGRVGSCHALTKSFETTVSELFLCVSVCGPEQRAA